MTIRELYDSGDYNIVIKMAYHQDTDINKLALDLLEKTSKQEGKEMTLGDLIAWIEDIAKPVEIRVSTSFAPIDWSSPMSWGSYSWPYKTLVKYDLDKITGYYKRVEPGDIIDRALLGLYKGFGIILLEKGIETIGGKEVFEEKGIPIMVFLDKNREPKRVAIFVTERNDNGYTGYILTSRSELIPFLEEHGFNAPSTFEPLQGYKIYKLEMEKTFESPTEFNYFIKSLRDLLENQGYLLFKHDNIGLTRGLPVKVEEIIQ